MISQKKFILNITFFNWSWALCKKSFLF